MNALEHTAQLNQFIRAHAGALRYANAQTMPRSPIEWLTRHFAGVEMTLFMTVILALILRGASPEHCVQYLNNRMVRLPFQGFEHHCLDTMLARMAARGYSPDLIGLIMEITAVMSHGIERFGYIESLAREFGIETNQAS